MSIFDKEINRANTNSIKWDTASDELPMWVADMDFETAPAILEAIANRVNHGVFGYTKLPEEWYTTITKWYSNRYSFKFEKENLLFSPGVIGSISTVIRATTKENDKVMVMTPVYNTFYDTIEATKRIVVEHKLTYTNNKYSLNISKFEEDVANHKPQILILCNPHNPLGKVWSKQELTDVGKVCKDNNVLVISDEIHGDLVLNDSKYTPFASVNEINRQNSVTCIAPTKTFNLAGLHTSSMIIFTNKLNQVISDKLYADGVMLSNIFGIEGSIAAYKYGEDWLGQLIEYLRINKQVLKEYLQTNIPELIAVGEDATYLEWIDCSALTDDSQQLSAFIREHTGLYIAEGTKYRGNGNSFMRINLATTHSNVQDGLKRLSTAVDLYKQQNKQKDS